MKTHKNILRVAQTALKNITATTWSRTVWTLIFSLFFLLATRYVRASIDDLFIILRYVENAASGHGFVYNIGERVEGYTCFGWVLVLVWLVRMGWPAYWAAKLIGMVCSMASLWLCYCIGREFWHGYRHSRLAALVPVLLLGVNPDFLYWSVSGLETSLFATVVMAVLYLLVLETRLAREQDSARWAVSATQAVLCSIATLVRPEGLVLLAYAFLAKLVMWRRKREWLWHCAVLALAAVVPLCSFFLWRHAYYGEWLPSTYYAKVADELLDRVHHGKHYLFGCFASNAFGWLGRHGQTAWPGALLFFALPVVALPFVRRKRAHLVVFLWTIMFTVVVVWEGGDWMPHHRFLVPVLGCWMLLLSHSVLDVLLRIRGRLRSLHRYLVTAFAISLVVILFADFIRLNIRHSPVAPLERDDSWPVVFSRYVLQDADHGTLAASDIGLIGYITHYRVIDLAGLVDRHIAHSPGNSFQKDYDVGYVVDQAPDFIVLTDQRCIAEDRIRQHTKFISEYQFVKKHEGHFLYVRKDDERHRTTP